MIPAHKPRGWAVQVAVFSNQSSANMLCDRLRKVGFNGYVDSVKSGDETNWRVRAGPVATHDAAETLRTQVAQRIRIRGIIVAQK